MAQEQYIHGVINSVEGKKLTVTAREEGNQHKIYHITSDSHDSRDISHHPGDKVLLAIATQADGKAHAYIADFDRTTPLLVLFLLFMIFVVGIGRWKGVFSFLGMLISFAIIMWFIIPSIVIGNNPILISLLGALFIIPITFYLAHGVSRKTTLAVVATFISLAVTGILAWWFVGWAKLTGFEAEEVMFVQTIYQGTIDIRNLLLAGIIIGAMGILDDITISQVSIVQELRIANPKYTRWQLFSRAMVVGRDHISSLVNTLILVYTGSALSLLLLFQNAQVSYGVAINHEMVATGIIRTLVSSIGIISAVPITTAMACLWGGKK